MKALKNLTKKEYNKLIKADLLQVLYPEATGDYEQDMKEEELSYDMVHFQAGEWVNIQGKIQRLEQSGLHIGGKDCILREATPQEIEQHLIEEAKKRYPVGTQFIDVVYGYIRTSKGYFHIFERSNGTKVLSDGNFVYDIEKNEWAEIIEEPIKIGGYEAKIHEDGSVDIGCEYFCGNEVGAISRLFNICKSENLKLEIDGDFLKVYHKTIMISRTKYDELFKYHNKFD